ncbi:MarR family winged helix-turn-helix transcriptional regulator [Streptomyces acidiscabies]|uniref:MarR family winged helix-turn-helix transcriptional regulator n=1 Tax=Streptomyces acidiscabies TaxID=42234 RepID=UPI00073EE2E6|nr:MarR family winged helix-turn-helix transcriptional regulator [Streptomyces acidiscabies]GAQ53106.1 multidrug resistance operon repressor [Streptomyces acidiscabies]GAV37990.1 multidrug resistance operon repressor [Streptomyces acidiscabies]
MDAKADAELLREARDLAPVLHALGRVLRLRGTAEAGLPALPPAELDVLRQLLDSPGSGVGVLAQELGMHASNVSTTVRGLVAQGLVRREPDPADRRAVRLFPTMAAVQGMAMIEQEWARLFAESLGALTPDERTALSGAAPALRSLAGSLRARRTDDGPRPVTARRVPRTT